jgi:hypothetical protein
MRVMVLIGIGLLALVLAMLMSGCVSAPPGARAGWSVSLVSITVQMGGTRTDPTIETINTVGPNGQQTHTLPVTAEQTAGATSIPLTQMP